MESPRLVEEVLALGKPAVNVAYWLDDPRLPLVGNDNAAIGRAVAEHFLERNFRHFAYAGWPGYLFSDQREEGFRSVVHAAGYDCVCYQEKPRRPRWRLTASPADQERLQRWLARLAIPSAVMAANDIRAWQVLQACQELERNVPEEIAVVGVDNDEAWCLLAQPPLSSVAVAAEQIGYLAGAKLARLLAGRRVEHRTVVPPLGVIARRSSDTLAISDRTVAAVVRFIREHADRPIGIRDVLRAVPVSRRALERAFRRILGRSPATEIRQAHLRRATDLLASTDLGMADVARLSGFTSSKLLATVFRQHKNLTATEYRKQFRFPLSTTAG